MRQRGNIHLTLQWLLRLIERPRFRISVIKWLNVLKFTPSCVDDQLAYIRRCSKLNLKGQNSKGELPKLNTNYITFIHLCEAEDT